MSSSSSAGRGAAVVQKVTRTIPIVTLTSGDLGLTIPQAILLPADQVIACPEKGRCD